MPDIRWQAEVTYRTDSGEIGTVLDLEEIGDLQRYVEAGPHWDTIVRIVIKRVNHKESRLLTVEQAKLL